MNLARVKQGPVGGIQRKVNGIGRSILTNYLVVARHRRSLPTPPTVVANEIRDLSCLIAAQEEERARIARELHDDLSQRMALLCVGLDQLIPQFPEAGYRKQLCELIDAAHEVATELHNISHQLHPAKLERLGLVAALSSHCRESSLRYGFEIEFEQENVPRELPPDVSLCLYRILQEALRNVQKHSGVKRAIVNLRGYSLGLELTVSDPGVGFKMAPKKSGGLGLISIEERLRLVNGELTIESAPSRGTQISAWVPLPEGKRAAAAACGR